ncbi:GIY-YIG nuclease family protein [Wenyingzhuangia sp. chi5]|uniref:GIY-YIG nuclease family protein n=1 Tax=Wenyingzhuangia gilva TaxID=3057677 RepID=A0ABT8VQM2_9FLAO|nr:GIY-YIG nuclease family protein [Wenyingzhuangia sp. chi5]MDO3694269.1 GIY-YIG nuclease family protein [Wenyingzhuangia sp. chi5]
MIYFVYILHCSDNTYYTGITNHLNRRIEEHQSGKNFNSYTSRRLPVQLVYYCTFTNVEVAIAKEKQIKKWSKAKKEALINNEFDKLPNLAKKKFPHKK